MTKLLIFTLLVGSLGWAADRHAEAFYGHTVEVVLHDTLSHPHDGGETLLAHHCCNAAVHLLAFPTVPPMLGDAPAPATIPPYTVSYRSLTLSPPAKPPKV